MIETIITSSVLIVLILIIRKIFNGRIRPIIQYSLWGLVLLRLIFPFNFFGILQSPSSSLSVMNAVQSAASSVPVQIKPLVNNITTGVTNISNDNTASSIGKIAAIDWQLVFLVLWFVGFIIVSAWLVFSNVHFTRLMVANRKRLMEYDCKLPIYTVAKLPSPCLFVYKKEAAIYVDEDIASDSRRMGHIIAHELSHYKHGDHIWAVIRSLLISLYWFNPLVWIAAIISRYDSELACDEAAINMLGEDKRIEYGRTLIGLINVNNKSQNLMCMATTMKSDEKGIKKRIQLIAKRPKMITATVLILVATLLFTIGCTFTRAKVAEDKQIMINARVTELSLDGKSVLVEGIGEKDIKIIGDACSLLYIEGVTTTLNEDGKEIPFSNLKNGDYIRVQIEDGIMESYPTRAKATTIQLVTMSNGIELTTDIIKELAKKGDNLRFTDLSVYAGKTDIGSGLYILRYPVNKGQYFLTIGGGSMDEKPFYVRLSASGTEAYVDILTGNIDEYLKKYSKEFTPMVYFNDNMYRLSPAKLDLDPSKLVQIGKIVGTVKNNETPTKNGYANHDILGALIYDSGDNIIVLWNNQYLSYELAVRGVLTSGKKVTYTNAEIESAKACVLRYFKDTATTRTMKKLWFDEEKSAKDRESYMLYGMGQINGVKPENVIVLHCDFEIKEEPFTGNYSSWKMILIRDSTEGTWRVDDQGV